MQPSVVDAVLAAALAAVIAVALTPLTRRVAERVGAIDEPRARGLAIAPMPRLGGLAIFAGAFVAGYAVLPHDGRWAALGLGAALITLVGALDDVLDLHPAVKLLGQVAAAAIPVHAGMEVTTFTLPFVHRVDLGSLGVPLTVAGIVAVMNVVNFSDGVDGLAAGVCAIAAASFSVIAFDLGKEEAAVLAAVVAGSALGFLVHNFHPASVFMGDCGSNLLGLLLGCTAVEGAVKTQTLLALVLPLVVLAVPFLDTTFVVLKRMKYRRPVYHADANHFHHRFNRIGFSQRRTVLYLYAWTLLLGGAAIALRFVPYSDNSGRLNVGWSLVMGGIGVVVLIASGYLVYVLEILKFRRIDALRLRRTMPDLTDEEVEADVERRLATGEFEALRDR